MSHCHLPSHPLLAFGEAHRDGEALLALEMLQGVNKTAKLDSARWVIIHYASLATVAAASQPAGRRCKSCSFQAALALQPDSLHLLPDFAGLMGHLCLQLSFGFWSGFIPEPIAYAIVHPRPLDDENKAYVAN